MQIKNLTLGACLLLAGTALAQNHYNTHLVHKGETLDKISKWTGVSKSKIVAANNLSTHKFRPGLKLRIPVYAAKVPVHYDLSSARGFAPYTIRKNDRDWKIATMFHMKPAEVQQLNPKVAWNHPPAGVKIRIPMRNAYIYKLASMPVLRSRYAFTTRPQTIVRSKPGSNATRVTVVDAGRHVRVLDRSDHWYQVRFEQGTEGWVRGDLLRAAPEPKVYAHHSSSESSSSHRPQARLASYQRASSSVHRTGRGSRGYIGNLPSAGGDMLQYAQSMKGVPYSYGSSSRHGTDCSGYTLQVLRHVGVNMPRTAAEQSTKGQHISRNELKPGDLVFFHTSRGSRISHVGIYMGSGKFIHASSGGGKVQVNSLDEGYYNRRFATARRVAKVHRSDSKKEQVAKAHREDEQAMRTAEKEMKSSKVVDKVDN